MKTTTTETVRGMALNALALYNAGSYEALVDAMSDLLVASRWHNAAENANDAAFGLAYPGRRVDTARCHKMAAGWLNWLATRYGR